MRSTLKFSKSFLLLGILFFLSCKKQASCEECAGNKKNKSPIAIAGSDRLISLPTDSVLLDGSSSNDPDGSITRYLWTKISGPASFTILDPAYALTKVKTLVTGIYLFELKIIDDRGLSAKDTVQIIVNDATSPGGLLGTYRCFAKNLNWSLAQNGMMAVINPNAIAGTLDCSGFGAESLIPYHYDVWIQYEGSPDWIHLSYVFRDAIYSATQNIFLSSVIYSDPTGNDGPVSVPVVYAKPNSGIDFTKKVTLINTL